MLLPITSIARVDFTARESLRIIRAFAGKLDELPFSRLFRRLFFASLKRYESKTRSFVFQTTKTKTANPKVSRC
jgi:hypothetical protein